MSLPFDGAISAYLQEKAPAEMREAILSAKSSDIITPDYPHAKRMKRKHYEAELRALQLELIKAQRWVRETGQRVVTVFEGRDAAGKGGTIKRLREYLNPRAARVVALSKPSEREAGEWYFQRYIAHLPTEGEITAFDRSWYNRAVVERVFGFSTAEERARFYEQVNPFEAMLAQDGIILVKLWLNVGRAEQLRRFLDREANPLKQWKLSRIDVEGLSRWEAYSEAIEECFARTHTPHAPWVVIRADDKRRARLHALRTILNRLDYPGKDPAAIGPIDPEVCGGPEIWHG